MNRLSLHNKLAELKDFALSPPSSTTYKKLEEPLRFPRNLVGTHMDYIWRLILEGNDIINRGDSLVKENRFTLHDVLLAEKGLQALGRVVNASVTAPHADWKIIKQLPECLEKILTYHISKANACNVEGIRLATHTQEIHNDFLTACHNGDYLSLAKLYPYSDGLLDIDPEDWIPEALKGKMTLSEESHETQRARALKKIFKSASPLDPASVRYHLGAPETGINDLARHGLRNDYERNLAVWKDGQNLVSTLYNLTQQPRYQANYLPDLIPRDVAP